MTEDKVSCLNCFGTGLIKDIKPLQPKLDDVNHIDIILTSKIIDDLAFIGYSS